MNYLCLSNKNIMSTPNKVWFITGCSTGFGRELAKEALSKGYNVVVTARKPEQVADIVAAYPIRHCR
jgi:NAD(P)-dependent dehydrogenase (short-subunit alcohol dehydrogenase family)